LYFLFPSSAPTEIYSLSLHDALPIWRLPVVPAVGAVAAGGPDRDARAPAHDRARDDLRAAGSGGDRLPGARTGQSERADARQAHDDGRLSRCEVGERAAASVRLLSRDRRCARRGADVG